MVAVQPWSGHGGDEELRAVGVWTGVGHRQLARLGVLDVEVFVGKSLAVDGLTAHTVEVGDVTTLDHELWDDSVENGVLEAKTLFTSTQGSEVFSCLRNNLVEQFKDNSWLLFTVNGNVKKDLGLGLQSGGELSSEHR